MSGKIELAGKAISPSARMSGMGQFSLRRLFVATSLIACGCGALVYLFRSGDQVPPMSILQVACAFGGGPLIGAGVLTPIKLPILGAFLGFVAFISYMAYWASVSGL